MRNRYLLLAVICFTLTMGLIVSVMGYVGMEKTPSSMMDGKVASIVSPPGTIDGSVTPNAISDRVAYLILFRMIPEGKNDVPRERAKNDLKRILGSDTSCHECAQGDENKIANQFDEEDAANVDAMISRVDEFHRRVAILDQQAKEIKDRNWPQPSTEVMWQLKNLQIQKEALVDEIVLSLPNHLTQRGIGRLQLYVNEHVKRKIKMIPSPSGPPNSPGWKNNQLQKHH